MTTISMIYDKNDRIKGFKVEGHSGYNLKGPDILCASISTASQMTINGILDFTGLSVDDIVTKHDEEGAILWVQIPFPLYEHDVVIQLIRSFKLFVKQLEKQYIYHVKVKEQKEG